MEICDPENPEDFGFEIASSIGQRGIVKALMRLPGVKIVRRPTGAVLYFEYIFWLAREECFCEFEFEGDTFQVFEPFGDSDRFWIGPLEKRNRSPHILQIREYCASL